ncbi:MAG: hypothetical protein KAS72_08865 [Phycisphaerales bacterium]|nr:hypothetical protein [Phycisphaerales bacterium]
MTRRRLTTCVLLIASVIAAPSRGQDEKEPAAQSGQAEYSVEQGPIRVVLAVNTTRVTVTDRIDLVIQVAADPDIVVTWPDIGERLGGLTVISQAEQTPLLDADDRMVRRTYITLEPFLPGEFEIPPLTFRYTSGTGADDAGELVTLPIPITVVSLLDDAQATTLGDIHNIIRPTSLDRRLLWFGIPIAVAVALGMCVMIRLMRTRNGAAVPLDARILAKLAALDEAQLTSEGEFDRFFTELSNILRWYVEQRFDLNAPDRTTEEFLTQAKTCEALRECDVATLDEFLSRCDLVKFAQAGAGESQARTAMEMVRRFVSSTAHAPETDARTRGAL